MEERERIIIDARAKVERINNKYSVGQKVIYWPICEDNVLIRKGGKRTRIYEPAFVSNEGFPVIFLEGIIGFIHLDNIEIVDKLTFSKAFSHRWHFLK